MLLEPYLTRSSNGRDSKGLSFLRGPFNPSTNYDVGLLIEGFQYPPSIMMPYNPSYYVQLVESYGFSKEKDLLAVILEKNQKKVIEWNGWLGELHGTKKLPSEKPTKRISIRKWPSEKSTMQPGQETGVCSHDRRRDVRNG